MPFSSNQKMDFVARDQVVKTISHLLFEEKLLRDQTKYCSLMTKEVEDEINNVRENNDNLEDSIDEIIAKNVTSK